MKKNSAKNDLGLPNELQDIKVEDLLGNETAIRMFLNNYKKIDDENNMLKQDLNRQATFERTLQTKETYIKVAAFLSLAGTICLSFGINFVSGTESDVSIEGVILILVGIVSEIFSLYFSFKKEGEND